MGVYIYKTLPSLVCEVAVKFDNGNIGPEYVAGYRYAYKSSWDSRKDRVRTIKPAERAWKKSLHSVPGYGVLLIGDKANAVKLGDRIFRTHNSVSVSDDDLKYIGGTIINLDPRSTKDERTLAMKIDPEIWGYSILQDYVGNIILHDYGVKHFSLDNPQQYLEAWKSKLDPDDRELFEQMEASTRAS